MPLDLDTYAREAERFVSALDHEYYLHFAGHKEEFEIEPIYERHRSLFSRAAVEELKTRAAGASGDDLRRARYLLQLAVEGLGGLETKAQVTAIAESEASLEVEFDGTRESYRQAVIAQSNETSAERREAIELARLDALEEHLNPLHVEIVERLHELAVELGWPSYRAMFEQLKGLDLSALEGQTQAFLEATEAGYRAAVEPELVKEIGVGFDGLRRSDLPYFFRARGYDHMFPAERLVECFERTLAGLGIDLGAQRNVLLDLEQRPRKSPRAFCAPVQVPQEIHLVIPRRGGRDDYAALFHEGGHTEHYAGVDAELPFEFRQLGDNSVTEGFAFLLEHLIEDPSWLETVLGAPDPAGYPAYARASKLLFLRRYAAKLSYELELHSGRRPLADMPDLYAHSLGRAVGVEWPARTYLSDVDEGYYCANYLRAWAFEAQLRLHLCDRFGDRWFLRREAGDLLRSLWKQGQRRDADELLADLTGGRLDFSLMVDEVE